MAISSVLQTKSHRHKRKIEMCAAKWNANQSAKEAEKWILFGFFFVVVFLEL